MQGGETMMPNMSQYVAVDVSKAMLDIFILSFAEGAMPGANRVWRSANTVAGIDAFRKRLTSFDHPHVVCEATGRYGRLLARKMGAAGIAISVVNPRQVRDFDPEGRSLS
jgi:transposase